MSVKLVTRGIKQWRDITVGEFDCYIPLADLEKGKALSTDKFGAFGSLWYFCVKGTKQWCTGMWKLDAMLRCLATEKGFHDFYSCEITLGEERLRPIPSNLRPAFRLYYCTKKVADRDLRERFTREGTVCIHMAITMSNSARFVAENMDLKFREDTPTGMKRSVDERKTRGRLEDDTGKTEQPLSESKTGGTGKVERSPSKSKTGGLKRDTSRAEQPSPESKTSGLEGENCNAERPQTDTKTGALPQNPNGADILFPSGISKELGWLFAFCSCMCNILDCNALYWIVATLGLLIFRNMVWNVLKNGESLTYLHVLIASSCCVFVPAYFMSEFRMIKGDLIWCLFLHEWARMIFSERKATRGFKGTQEAQQ